MRHSLLPRHSLCLLLLFAVVASASSLGVAALQSRTTTQTHTQTHTGAGADDHLQPNSASWMTEGGSNARTGFSSLSLPVHRAAPMQRGWSLPLLEMREGDCAPSMVATKGIVFLLCEETVLEEGKSAGSDSELKLLPTIRALQITAGGAVPLWRARLDALPAETTQPIAPPAQGSLALTADGAYIVACTRGGVYALNVACGSVVWRYQFLLTAPAFPLGTGLAIGSSSALEPQPRVYVSLNLGVACVQGGQLVWQHRSTDRGDLGEMISVSSPTLDEDSGTLIYTYFRSSDATLTAVGLDARSGEKKWAHPFRIARRYLRGQLLPTRASAAVLVKHTAFVSVRGRGIVVLHAASGEVFNDGRVRSGARVQQGVKPALAAAHTGRGETDLLLSVCMKPKLAESDEQERRGDKWLPLYQLCLHDLAGVALNVTDRYKLGCKAGRHDDFDPRPVIAQPLYGANGVAIVALAGAGEVEGNNQLPSSCLNALPDGDSGLKRWELQLAPGEVLASAPVFVSPTQALVLMRDRRQLYLHSMHAKVESDAAQGSGQLHERDPVATLRRVQTH